MTEQNDLYNAMYDYLMNFLGKGAIQVKDLEEKIKQVKAILTPMYPGQDVDEEQLYRRVVQDYDIWGGSMSVLKDNTDHIEWLANMKASKDWTLWRRYKKYIENQRKMSPNAIKELDRSTDTVLGLMESPDREGNWDRRGMVVGNIQSGKTSNYVGLICKAVDAGYKVVIVLAGLNNDLRSQTQKRIDKGFLGRDTRKIGQEDQSTNRIGAGLLPGFDKVYIDALTSSNANGDFKKSTHSHVTITPGGNPIIVVVKKNVTPLTNLLDWFEKEGSNGKIRNVPLLLTDDEADNASVDTKATNKMDAKPGDDAFEQDPSRINGLIRQILNCFTQSAYVGYTATPFANIFIYPTDENNKSKKFGEDLYPRSFIVNLEPPSNYFGPEMVFGLDYDKAANIQEIKPLPLTRPIEDYQEIFPDKHKSTLVVTGLPDSLYQAIYAFILSCAARDVRGQDHEHHSMLIHVTRFVDVQSQIVGMVQEVMQEIVNELEMKTGPQYKELIQALHDLWISDFEPTTKAVMNRINDNEITEIAWNEIEDRLYKSASKIEVKAVNGKAADGGIDYDLYPDGCSVIAIGGDKLSRGLTLEGLAVSYYTRASKMYDTLLQMGRWFGYRTGYEDLCRLYTSPLLIKYYKHIAVANEELRRELDDMADMGSNPEQYGLKVRTHPDGMIITALNKMRNSATRRVTFAGTLTQITRFDKNSPVNQQNLQKLDEWISSLPNECETISYDYVWRNIKADKIYEFLDAIKINSNCFSASPSVVKQYISAQQEDDELTEWTVALISNHTGIYGTDVIGGKFVGYSFRTDVNDDTDTDTIWTARNNLITPDDQGIDLSTKEKEEAMKETWIEYRDNPQKYRKEPTSPYPGAIRKVRPSKRALLLIYPFKSGKEKGELYPETYIGYAISWPASKTAKSVEYKVDEVYARNEIGDDEY